MHTRPQTACWGAAILTLALPAALALADWPTDGAPLSVFPCRESPTSAVADAHGGAYVVWTDNRTCSSDEVYVLRVTGAGLPFPGWPSSGMPVCTNGAGRSGAIAVADGSSGVIVVWNDSRLGGSRLYAERIGPDGTRRWDPEGVALCDAPGDQGGVALLSDGQGGAFFAWMDWRRGLDDGGPHHHPVYDLYAQHVDAQGARTWPDQGVPILTLATTEIAPTLITDGSSGLLATWLDARGPVYLQHLDASGAPLLAENGVGIPGRFYGMMTSDGAGGIISTFMYGADTYEDMYAQRINSNGTLQWPINGVLVEQAGWGQRPNDIIPDGNGGAFIASYDLRFGRDWDIFVQRITSSGARAPGWPENGLAVCTLPGFQIYPRLSSDLAGGCVVTWPDARDPAAAYDIYAQRVTGEGGFVPGWPDQGVRLCHANGDQIAPIPVSDGSGGAIVAWDDYRVYADVYAQRVNGMGQVGAAGPAVGVGAPQVSKLTIHRIVPNPLHAGGAMLVSLSLPANAPADLVLFDTSGRRLARKTVPAGNRGLITLRWEDPARISAGLYWVRVTQGAEVASAKVTIIH